MLGGPSSRRWVARDRRRTDARTIELAPRPNDLVVFDLVGVMKLGGSRQRAHEGRSWVARISRSWLEPVGQAVLGRRFLRGIAV
jgi:hypothetical protein